jgi:hypothetical protein
MPADADCPASSRYTEYLSSLADGDAEYIRKMETRHTEPSTIADYQNEISDRLVNWTAWHTERAEARGMQRGGVWRGLHALDLLADALAELALPRDAGDDTIDAVIAAAHTCLTDAKHGADMDRRHDGEADPQCLEIECSDLRQLLRVWVDLELIRRAARDGQMPPQRAQLVAAEAFIFGDVPGHPPGEDV